jgi:hypothetical protein
MSRRERVAWCWFLVIYTKWIYFVFVLYYIMFSCLIWLSLHVLSTLLVSSLVWTVWPVCLVSVWNSRITHTVSFPFDLFVSIPYATPVPLTLAVCDAPIQPALLSVSYVEIPTSTWEACSTASTSRCLPSPPSCPVAMYVLKTAHVYERIGGTCCPHPQGWRIAGDGNKCRTIVGLTTSPCLLPVSFRVHPYTTRLYIPFLSAFGPLWNLMYRVSFGSLYICTRIYGATSQKAVIIRLNQIYVPLFVTISVRCISILRLHKSIKVNFSLCVTN